MKFLLPFVLVLFTGCSGSMCGGSDYNYNISYNLFIKLLDSTSIITELKYENSNVNLKPLKSSCQVPVSYLESFTIFIKTNKDSGTLYFSPKLSSTYENNICKSYREIKFMGLNFKENGYPGSFMKRKEYYGQVYYSSTPELYIDTLYLKQ